MKWTTFVMAALVASLGATGCSSSGTPGKREMTLHDEVEETILLFQARDPTAKRFFESAIAWAVFPDVGKGAVIVGAAHGNGELFEGGRPTGRVVMSQGTVGLALGGQAFREIIFFQDQPALERFKGGTFEFSGNASAIAVRSGAASAADYDNGVIVFVMTRAGLMLEASLGGQRFSYHPF